MAGDNATTLPCMTLFFSLLLAFRFAMAVPNHQQHTFSPLSTSTKDDAKNKRNNNMVATAASTKEGSTQQNLKTTKGIHHVPDLRLKGPKGRRSRAPKPPLQWKNKIFNQSEHEVPSGPNPISNR